MNQKQVGRSADAAKSDYSIKLLPLGGLGEVGMNCMLIAFGDEFVMVDCGVTFPDSDAFGIDIFMSDWRETLEEVGDRLVGIVLTHGHEDHIGAMPHLVKDLGKLGLKVPVYSRPLTLMMVEHKLREHNLLGQLELREVKPREEISLGSLTFEFVSVNHSIPQASAVVFHTPLGAVIHTGDWKVDYTPVIGETTDLARFAEYGDEGVFCLLGDSTNVMVPGTSRSESDVAGHLRRQIEEAPGRVIVTLFSSNLERVQGLLDTAHGLGRKVLIMGRSLVNNIGNGRECGVLKLPSEDLLIESYDVENYPPDKILVLSTGSQGEPRSAMTQMAYGERRQLQLTAGDRVILSARVIPGNELGIDRMMCALARLGVEVVTAKDAPIHTTGHAYQDEMRLLLNLTRPRYFVPVHGTSRMLLRHARLAEEVGVPDSHVLHNGDVLDLSDEGMELIDQRHLRRQYIDGKQLEPGDSNVVRERKRIARSGVIVVVLELDIVEGELLSDPQVVQRGAWDLNIEPEMDHRVVHESARAFKALDEGDKCDPAGVREAVRLALRKFFKVSYERKPVIEVVVSEVDE